MDLLQQLNIFNSHWVKPIEIFDFQRDSYLEINHNMNTKFILSLFGSRRTGKTVIMKQLIRELIANGVDAGNILYFSFDLFKSNIAGVLDEYALSNGIRIDDKKLYVFLDEIQFVDNWASELKVYYDNFTKLKFVISGSASLNVKRGAESLAGRELEFWIPPLSFSEYLAIKDVKLPNKLARWNEYMIYMKRQLPELVTSELNPGKYISQIVRKTIYQDIPSLFNVSNPEIIESIFRIICRLPGQIIQHQDLAGELGISRHTVSKYLHILEDSLLIRKVYNYSGSIRKTEKRHKRYYPLFSTLHEYTSPHLVEFGRIAETEVAFQINAEYFLNDRSKEIDFLVGNDLKIGVEVKMRKHIKKSDLKWLLDADWLKSQIVVVRFDSDVRIPENKQLKIIVLSDIHSYKDEFVGNFQD